MGKAGQGAFYMEDQQDIMDNISDIADKLGRVERNKSKLAEIIKRDGKYDKKKYPLLTSAQIEEIMEIESAFVDEDDDGLVLSISVSAKNGALGEGVMIELLGDGSIEVSCEGKIC